MVRRLVIGSSRFFDVDVEARDDLTALKTNIRKALGWAPTTPLHVYLPPREDRDSWVFGVRGALLDLVDGNGPTAGPLKAATTKLWDWDRVALYVHRHYGNWVQILVVQEEAPVTT